MLERAREQQAGIRAERSLQLPPRDDTGSVKAAAKLEERVAEGRRLRLQARAARRVGDAGRGHERGRGQERRTPAADEPAYELEPLPSQTARPAGRTTR